MPWLSRASRITAWGGFPRCRRSYRQERAVQSTTLTNSDGHDGNVPQRSQRDVGVWYCSDGACFVSRRGEPHLDRDTFSLLFVCLQGLTQALHGLVIVLMAWTLWPPKSLAALFCKMFFAS